MKQILDCIMDIGEEMLICGAEIHRVEDSITRMGYAYGATRVDVFSITSSLVVTIHTDVREIYTQSRRIVSSTTNIEKLHRLNDLCRKICRQPLTAQDIQQEIRTLRATKSYPLWLECISYAIIAGAFTLFFGGNWLEGALSLIIGAINCFVVKLTDKMLGNKIFAKFFCAFAMTGLSYICLKYGWVNDVDKIIIGNIMTLIPGIGLTNALRDLLTGDSIAGLLRTIEATLIALAIAAGYFLFSLLVGGIAV